MKYIRNIGRVLYDFPGIHTKRKIVVIESDDWGTIRMPSLKTYNSIPDKYKKYYDSPYYKFDTLASSEDLTAMFEILSNVKDKNGKCAVVTANCIMANPDFEKIENSNFTEYHFEHFTETLNKNNGNVFNIWKEGIKNDCFQPQLHGREHVNFTAWMDKLINNDPIYIDAFKRGMFSVNHDLHGVKKNLTASLDSSNATDSLLKAKSIEEACDIFRYTFGYDSRSFIATSYTWDNQIENALNKKGVKFLQGIRVQKIPTEKDRIYTYKKHFFGQKNKYGQMYLIRNAFFEPSLDTSKDVVNEVLSRMNWSFKMRRPSIISMHRLNMVGALDIKNRDKNLSLLKELLSKIVKKWPDVEFLSTDELNSIMN